MLELPAESLFAARLRGVAIGKLQKCVETAHVIVLISRVPES
jgi:hypothetical protein